MEKFPEHYGKSPFFMFKKAIQFREKTTLTEIKAEYIVDIKNLTVHYQTSIIGSQSPQNPGLLSKSLRDLQFGHAPLLHKSPIHI